MERILEKNGCFYPQRRFLFLWCNYEDYYGRDICFLSLERAKEFFETPRVKIHPYP